VSSPGLDYLWVNWKTFFRGILDVRPPGGPPRTLHLPSACPPTPRPHDRIHVYIHMSDVVAFRASHRIQCATSVFLCINIDICFSRHAMIIDNTSSCSMFVSLHQLHSLQVCHTYRRFKIRLKIPITRTLLLSFESYILSAIFDFLGCPLPCMSLFFILVFVLLSVLS
jgi:hypothetical protein